MSLVSASCCWIPDASTMTALLYPGSQTGYLSLALLSCVWLNINVVGSVTLVIEP